MGRREEGGGSVVVQPGTERDGKGLVECQGGFDVHHSSLHWVGATSISISIRKCILIRTRTRTRTRTLPRHLKLIIISIPPLGQIKAANPQPQLRGARRLVSVPLPEVVRRVGEPGRVGQPGEEVE